MKKHEKKYIEVEGIMRACYDSFLKTGNKAYSEIISLAEAVPAADVQEVRHGRWIVHGAAPWLVVECSNCGAKWHHWSGEKTANYCGACGATMDEVSG